ncbi:MlaD family protein [Mesorhizobium sp. BAC0120]|uniref:MlaD family protein n=1 Tax=Mesorhizobium sp. BAC0120 TaxID=3090670 RepID=UPI00298CCC3F|nr:MlaD family protein [Mesorhizobium sp. BAC0120]MDW6026453.1 MlaD family protein [Mesorhizobium sp. BAC0120]
METKANYVIVGIFTLLAILAAFAFVYWSAAIGERGETALLRVRIPGSAAGLSRGSGVLFNGVRVGDVQRVYIDVNDPTLAIADTQVDRLTPITKSTRADIGIAGLTGQANIELRGANLTEPKLLDQAEEEGKIAEITASPSAVTNLLERAQDIFNRADKVLTGLDGFVTDVRTPLTNTITNAEKFSQALGNNAQGVDEFLASVTKLSGQLARASDKLDATLDAAEGLIRSVDKEQVKEIVSNVETLTKSLSQSVDKEQVKDIVGNIATLTKNLSESSKQVEGVVARVDGAVKSITEFSDGARETLARVDKVIESVDPNSVRETIGNIQTASKNANKVVEDVSKVTTRFRDRADDVDKFIADARQLADRLNRASVRVDGILAKVDSLLGSGETRGLVTQASETLKSFKQAADTLNSRLGTIMDGLSRFSNQGLQDATGLIRDARRSINRIEEAVTDFQRNPQRLISGGEGTVREFDGRARR